jgi:hypothetical protein
VADIEVDGKQVRHKIFFFNGNTVDYHGHGIYSDFYTQKKEFFFKFTCIYHYTIN